MRNFSQMWREMMDLLLLGTGGETTSEKQR